MVKVISALALFFVAHSAQALIAFSDAEKVEHQNSLPIILQTAAQCLQNTFQDHQRFHATYSASKYYGDARADYRTVEQRANALMNSGFSEISAYQIAQQQVATACITLTLDCLGRGFKKAGGLSVVSWNKIESHMRAVDFLGTELQIALQDLGWKIYYWNPSQDPEQMSKWDENDRRIAPLSASDVANNIRHKSVWGNHLAHFKTATTAGRYYRTRVDNATALVGLGDQMPAAFAQVPFFVGIAHVGYHVFPGFYGRVIEAHSKRHITAKDNLESSWFNPLAPGGGPRWTRTEQYRSGLVAVPYDF